MKKTVLILCGGKSEEHEVSLVSARCILEAIDRDKFDPILVGISRKGTWYLEDESNAFLGGPKADTIKLNQSAPEVSVIPYPNASGQGQLRTEKEILNFDVVFPIIHGTNGEDGTLQGFFEILGAPYVGSNCGASWNCMDKQITKEIAEIHGRQSAAYVPIDNLAEIDQPALKKLKYPLFVKPNRTGSSVGVTRVTEASQLRNAVENALKLDRRVLVEEGISGREIECAVLGLNRKAKSSLPGEIIPSKEIGFYSYEAKYILEDGAKLEIPAKLSEAQVKSIQEFAINCFDLMGCDGLARVDLFLDEANDKIYLNEINTLPGFTPISMYPKLWEISGVSYKDLITKLIQLAFERQSR